MHNPIENILTTMKKLILIFTTVCFASLSSFSQFSFIHITDLHVSDTIFSIDNHDLDGQYFQCYIKEFANLTPKIAFVAASGDISNVGNLAKKGMYPTITQYLFPPDLTNPDNGAYFIDSAQSIPIYFTPGNHDYFKEFKLFPKSEENLNYYAKYLAPDMDYSVATDIAVIVFLQSGSDGSLLNDENPVNPEGKGISNEQCAWLRNILRTNISKRKIVIMHHPPVNAVGTSFDGAPYTGSIRDATDGSILHNRTNFLNICDSNKVDIVLCGHIHQNVVANRKGDVVSENWSGGTRYIQTAAAINRSFRIITVDSNFVKVSTPLLSCNEIADVVKLKNSLKISTFLNPVNCKLIVDCN